LSIAYLWDSLPSVSHGLNLAGNNQIKDFDSMATYKALQDEIAKLQRDAEEARTNEITSALAEIRALMSEYDISLQDVENSSKKKDSRFRQAPIKFQDNDGNTWSGRGRAPAWLKGKDKEQFRLG
jgi:DNA-binding protein H-NS